MTGRINLHLNQFALETSRLNSHYYLEGIQFHRIGGTYTEWNRDFSNPRYKTSSVDLFVDLFTCRSGDKKVKMTHPDFL